MWSVNLPSCNGTFPELGTVKVIVFPLIACTAAFVPIPVPVTVFPTTIPILSLTVIVLCPDDPEICLETDFGSCAVVSVETIVYDVIGFPPSSKGADQVTVS